MIKSVDSWNNLFPMSGRVKVINVGQRMLWIKTGRDIIILKCNLQNTLENNNKYNNLKAF